MATTTRMTPAEHTEIFQAMSESIVAEPETSVEEKEVDSRALRGALYLDEHHPGWADKIDLVKFDINDTNNCVVGQVAGYYEDHAHKLFPVGNGYTTRAANFGILPNSNSEVLQHSWTILIAERQTKEVVPS